METFSVITRLTKEEYSRLILRKAYKQVYVRILTVVGAIMFLTAVLELLDLIDIYTDTPVFQLVFGIMVLTFPLTIINQSKKAYDSNQRLQHDIKYTFGQNDVNVRTFSSDSTFSWTNIIRTEKIGNYLLLYSGKTVADIIEIGQLSKQQLEFIESKSRAK